MIDVTNYHGERYSIDKRSVEKASVFFYKI